MSKKLLVAVAVAGATLTTGTSAFAQQWLSDRAATQGRGLRVGNFEFHPGIGVEFGYDSNTRYAPATGMLAPSLHLRVTPSISVQTVDTTRELQGSTTNQTERTTAPASLPVAFRAHIAGIGHYYIPLTTPDTVSSISNIGFNAGIGLVINQGQPVNFSISESVGRAVQSGSDFGATFFVYNRVNNTASLSLGVNPNRGTVDFKLAYTNNFTYFEEPSFQNYTFMQHDIVAASRWKFFQESALLFEAGFTPTHYIGLGTITPTTGLSTGFPVRVRGGFSGLLTERIQVVAQLGYGATYFLAGDNTETVIADAQFQFKLSPNMGFRAGFNRDIQHVLLGNYQIRNRGYLAFNNLFAGAFYVNAEVGVGYYENGFIVDATTGTSGAGRLYTGTYSPEGRFGFVKVDASVFAEYRFNNYIGINATLGFGGAFSDIALRQDASTYQSISWLKFEAFLGARANF